MQGGAVAWQVFDEQGSPIRSARPDRGLAGLGSAGRLGPAGRHVCRRLLRKAGRRQERRPESAPARATWPAGRLLHLLDVGRRERHSLDGEIVEPGLAQAGQGKGYD